MLERDFYWNCRWWWYVQLNELATNFSSLPIYAHGQNRKHTGTGSHPCVSINQSGSLETWQLGWHSQLSLIFLSFCFILRRRVTSANVDFGQQQKKESLKINRKSRTKSAAEVYPILIENLHMTFSFVFAGRDPLLASDPNLDYKPSAHTNQTKSSIHIVSPAQFSTIGSERRSK